MSDSKCGRTFWGERSAAIRQETQQILRKGSGVTIGMKQYEVSEEYRTGNETIDQQHARMLDHTQRAYQLFTDENMLFKCADINKILEGLSFHTAAHFAYEEEYMREIGFDQLEEHIKRHEAFSRKLQEFIDRVPRLSLATQDEMLGEVFEYLQEWWKVHITQEDMKYVEFAEKRGCSDRSEPLPHPAN